jgi:hypothetical protein
VEAPGAALPADVAGMGCAAGVEGARRLKQALMRAWDLPDAKKGLWALLFALQAQPFGWFTARACARQLGVSVEDVNNVVDAMQEILGVGKSPAQKSEAAVKSYQRTNGARVKVANDGTNL